MLGGEVGGSGRVLDYGPSDLIQPTKAGKNRRSD